MQIRAQRLGGGQTMIMDVPGHARIGPCLSGRVKTQLSSILQFILISY